MNYLSHDNTLRLFAACVLFYSILYISFLIFSRSTSYSEPRVCNIYPLYVKLNLLLVYQNILLFFLQSIFSWFYSTPCTPCTVPLFQLQFRTPYYSVPPGQPGILDRTWRSTGLSYHLLTSGPVASVHYCTRTSSLWNHLFITLLANLANLKTWTWWNKISNDKIK